MVALGCCSGMFSFFGIFTPCSECVLCCFRICCLPLQNVWIMFVTNISTCWPFKGPSLKLNCCCLGTSPVPSSPPFCNSYWPKFFQMWLYKRHIFSSPYLSIHLNQIHSPDDGDGTFLWNIRRDHTLITNLMHWLLFIHKILFSSTCFEHQVLIFRRT